MGAKPSGTIHPDRYETILCGDLNDDDGPEFENTGENSYHVVTAIAVAAPVKKLLRFILAIPSQCIIGSTKRSPPIRE